MNIIYDIYLHGSLVFQFESLFCFGFGAIPGTYLGLTPSRLGGSYRMLGIKSRSVMYKQVQYMLYHHSDPNHGFPDRIEVKHINPSSKP